MPDTSMLVRAGEIHGLSILLVKFFNEGAEQRLKKLDLPLNSFQFGVLQMLRGERLTVSAISQRLNMDPSSIVRMVDALEGQGLVARGMDPRDRRRNPIQITPKGLEILAAVPGVTEEDAVVQALQGLGMEKATQLRDLLIHTLLRIPEGRAILEAAPRPPDFILDSDDPLQPD